MIIKIKKNSLHPLSLDQNMYSILPLIPDKDGYAPAIATGGDYLYAVSACTCGYDISCNRDCVKERGVSGGGGGISLMLTL